MYLPVAREKLYKPNTVQSSKQTSVVLNMQRKKVSQNEMNCGQTDEIFWVYCNVNTDSTSLTVMAPTQGRMMNNTYSGTYENYYVAGKHMYKATFFKVSL